METNISPQPKLTPEQIKTDTLTELLIISGGLTAEEAKKNLDLFYITGFNSEPFKSSETFKSTTQKTNTSAESNLSILSKQLSEQISSNYDIYSKNLINNPKYDDFLTKYNNIKPQLNKLDFDKKLKVSEKLRELAEREIAEEKKSLIPIFLQRCWQGIQGNDFQTYGEWGVKLADELAGITPGKPRSVLLRNEDFESPKKEILTSDNPSTRKVVDEFPSEEANYMSMYIDEGSSEEDPILVLRDKVENMIYNPNDDTIYPMDYVISLVINVNKMSLENFKKHIIPVMLQEREPMRLGHTIKYELLLKFNDEKKEIFYEQLLSDKDRWAKNICEIMNCREEPDRTVITKKLIDKFKEDPVAIFSAHNQTDIPFVQLITELAIKSYIDSDNQEKLSELMKSLAPFQLKDIIFARHKILTDKEIDKLRDDTTTPDKPSTGMVVDESESEFPVGTADTSVITMIYDQDAKFDPILVKEINQLTEEGFTSFLNEAMFKDRELPREEYKHKYKIFLDLDDNKKKIFYQTLLERKDWEAQVCDIMEDNEDADSLIKFITPELLEKFKRSPETMYQQTKKSIQFMFAITNEALKDYGRTSPEYTKLSEVFNAYFL